jgi:hypothetical protein
MLVTIKDLPENWGRVITKPVERDLTKHVQKLSSFICYFLNVGKHK